MFWYKMKQSNKPLAGIILLVLISLVFLASFSSAWWTPCYYRPITITEQSGNTLTDYQVAINITYDSDMQSDFDDLRFTWLNTSNNEEVEISYWIESKVDGSWAYVWVKVPEIPANDNATVYVYYGNPSATSESNGTAVFEFFDDFDDLDISDYTTVSGSFDVVEETMGSGNGILKGTASGTNLIIHNTVNTDTQKIIGAKVRPDSTSGGGGVIFGYQDSSNFYHVRINNYDDELQIYEWVSGSATKRGSTSVSITTGTWYILEAIWKNANTIEAKVYDANAQGAGRYFCGIKEARRNHFEGDELSGKQLRWCV